MYSLFMHSPTEGRRLCFLQVLAMCWILLKVENLRISEFHNVVGIHWSFYTVVSDMRSVVTQSSLIQADWNGEVTRASDTVKYHHQGSILPHQDLLMSSRGPQTLWHIPRHKITFSSNSQHLLGWFCKKIRMHFPSM